MMYRSYQSYNGNEQQEKAHCNDPTDDVDTGNQAKALSPCCYSN